MTTLREAAKQALEAMEYSGTNVGKFINRINAACAALRAALAQQAEPVEQLAELQAMLRAEVDRLIAAGIQPQRKLVPLTEEEIMHIGMTHQSLRQVARAVERAHGIT